MSQPINVQVRQTVKKLLDQAGVVLTAEEIDNLEYADLGLGQFETTGLALHVYVNTDRYCAKELVLLANQTCPEHRHPPVPEANDPGKRETFRVRSGLCYLYVEGPGQRDQIKAKVPADATDYYTVFHELTLEAGDQYTIPPDTLHWFQAGPDGAVISEFSSTSRDELDVFTDPRIQRVQEG